jgi:Na+/H+ antiporter NhaD/arsenite permease-like protein
LRPLPRIVKSAVLLVLAAMAALLIFVPRPLAAPEGDVAISGRLVDPQGEPVSRASVAALSSDSQIAQTETSLEGSFQILLGQLPERDLVLSFERPHFESRQRAISPSELESLAAGGALYLGEIALDRRITAGFWIAAATFVGVLVLIARETVHNTLCALLGMVVIFLVSYIGSPISPDLFILDFAGAIRYIDFNVIFLVMGMMIVISILEETGVFQWLAYWSYRASRGKIWLLSIILMLLTAVSSAMFDNVTTMLLMTPISLQIALALNLNPLSLLIPEVLASNVGGIATLIGTPTNILIGSYAGLSFNDFVVNLTPGVLLSQLALTLYVQYRFRKEYRAVGRQLSPGLEEKLAENARITRPVALRKAATVFVGMLVLFVAGEQFHLGAAVTALIGSILLLVWGQADVEEIVGAVDWTTILFFIGLFVCVGALEEVGLIGHIAAFLGSVIGDQLLLAIVLVTYAAAFLSAIVANIPFSAAMLPVIGFLTRSIPGAENDVLFYALSIGAAMGGNGSLIGASANLVTVGIAARAGYNITVKTFLKYGLPSMVITVTVGLLWLLVRF